ncbi:MAG: hypothetical protein FWB79_06890 [Treponema sp.]|nr:hypothetical protein [Treponema sp.]
MASKQEIIDEIKDYIKKNDKVWENWVMGITKDVERRLGERGVDKNGVAY